jgi:N-methylhydantoinase A
MITLRVVATVAVDALKMPKLAKGARSNPAEAKLYQRRTVFDDGTAADTPRYDRAKLLANDAIAGPALVVQHNSTTLVPPGYAATVLEYGDMRIGRAGEMRKAA